MPTQRFLKLKEEKKQVILDAAVHEFSRVPYSSASINQIIKEADISRGSFYTYFELEVAQADISRGSFYTYFEDKDDLMRYILRGFRDNCQKKIFKFLREEQGNPFEAAMGLLGIVMEQGEGGLGYRMYRNMLSDMSLMDQTHLFGIKGFLFQDSTYMEFVDKVHDGIDRERYLIERETLAYLVDMLMLIVIRTITMYYKNVAGKDQLLDVARREMQILENGISPGTFQNHMKGHTEKRGESI